MPSYDIGDVAIVSVAFTNQAGSAVDPATVLCRIKDPQGVIVNYTYLTHAELVRDSTGNYHVDLLLTKPGRWYARFEGTGTNRGASEELISVNTSRFYAPDGGLL